MRKKSFVKYFNKQILNLICPTYFPQKHEGGNGSCRVNPFPERVKKSSILIRPIYKRFDLFTTRLTRLIYMYCQIILELTRLNPNDSLKKKKT